MYVSQLVENLDCQLFGPDIQVKSITYDSRHVTPGSLFIAIRGFQADGHDFAGQAVQCGSVVIVVEEYIEDLDVSQVVVKDSRSAMGHIASVFYQNPSKDLRLIGVTGTNGKTTITYLIKAVLETAGFKVGLLGTIQNMIGDHAIATKRTTPESLDLLKLLADMVGQGVEYVVMEVSSHALALQRTVGVEYDMAIFTNLTQDHLDFHASFDDYVNAKGKLFNDLLKLATKDKKVAVVNFDDPYGLRIASFSSAPVYSYGIDQPVQVCATDVEVSSSGVKYRVVTPLGEAQLNLNLTGRFNVYNSLAAIAALLAEGLSLSSIKAGLESVPGVPGRFELVDAGQDFAVIVDYAHTPDSLENVLKTARAFVEGRLITVFGAGGDRDRSKRPIMGKVASAESDFVIVTSDNPRSEDPARICRDIQKGISEADLGADRYALIVNRREAICYGINRAQSGDIVLIAGKGHETYQEIDGTTSHFDDREVALEAIKERLSS